MGLAFKNHISLKAESQYLRGFGFVLAVEEFGQSTTFNRMNRIVIEPSGITGNDDVMGLICDVIVVLHKVKKMVINNYLVINLVSRKLPVVHEFLLVASPGLCLPVFHSLHPGQLKQHLKYFDDSVMMNRLKFIKNRLLLPLVGNQSASFLTVARAPPPGVGCGLGTSTSRKLVSEGGSSISRVRSLLSSSPRNFLPRAEGRTLFRLFPAPPEADGVVPSLADPLPAGDGDRLRLRVDGVLPFCLFSPPIIKSSTVSRSL